ncbi:olfactory receptor 10Q1-like [Takifugu flavidus]|uniref:olfactory receptor 10Q1-like n=1 Tax=Takifugu flavidus TaxID=433684 RepID=UPI002544A5D0|nr:olfactory receptor 10Q1-like [Takifugu flavidus]
MGQQLPGERGHAGSRPVVFVSPIMLSSVKSGVLLTRLPFGARVPQQHLLSVMNLSNSTLEACLQTPAFTRRTGYIVALCLIDILPLLVGLPLIARVAWVTFKSRKTTDILNLNLALINFPHYWISAVHLHLLLLQKNSHQRILRFLCVYGQMGGPLSVFFICLERYVAVVHPLHFQLLKTYRFREVSAVTVWCFTLFLSSIYIANSGSMEFFNERILDLPPVLLLATSVLTVHCSLSIMASLLTKLAPGRATLHPAKKKAFKTVCTNALVVLTCYSPVSLLQRVSFTEETQVFTVVPACVFLLSVASVVHPLLFLCGQRKLCLFRR